tara:strand:+ start:808 stop:927 length:120 start_codon:yes stop_codon:yes gene_type:complete
LNQVRRGVDVVVDYYPLNYTNNNNMEPDYEWEWEVENAR